MVLGGIGMEIAAGVLHYKNRDSDKLDITKITPKTASNENKNWPPGMNISTIQTAAVPNLDRN
jgi:hypothetical protein